MERVWTIVGLLWAIILILFGVFVLDSILRAKVAEIRSQHSQKKMLKKLEQGLSKAIEQQVENMINGKDNNAIEEYVNDYEQGLKDEEDSNE